MGPVYPSQLTVPIDAAPEFITFLCRDGKAMCEKQHLLTCDFFKQMFQVGMREQLTNAIELKEVSVSTVNAFIAYITREQPPPSEEFYSLLHLAHQWNHQRLMNQLITLLSQHLDQNNFAETVDIAAFLGIESLLNRCKEQLIRNYPQYQSILFELSQEGFEAGFLAVINWVDRNHFEELARYSGSNKRTCLDCLLEGRQYERAEKLIIQANNFSLSIPRLLKDLSVSINELLTHRPMTPKIESLIIAMIRSNPNLMARTQRDQREKLLEPPLFYALTERLSTLFVQMLSVAKENYTRERNSKGEQLVSVAIRLQQEEMLQALQQHSNSFGQLDHFIDHLKQAIQTKNLAIVKIILSFKRDYFEKVNIECVKLAITMGDVAIVHEVRNHCFNWNSSETEEIRHLIYQQNAFSSASVFFCSSFDSMEETSW